MKGNKILATLIVLAMVLSTVVVLKQLNIMNNEVKATTPGVDYWGYPENTYTEALEYSWTGDIEINTTDLEANTNYILYYPDYTSTYAAGEYTSFNLTWRQWGDDQYETGDDVNDGTTDDYPLTLQDITLNVSGLWVLTTVGTVPNGYNASTFSDSINKSFWVNTSSDYSLSIDPDEVYYGKTETIAVRVTNGGVAVYRATVDIRREVTDDAITGFPSRTSTDGYIEDFNSSYLTRAGNYTAIAYKDIDDTSTELNYIYTNGYNETFGNSSYDIDPAGNDADYYSYTTCGPWDPPELNSTYYEDKLLLDAGVPTATIPEGNATMYWGFPGQVNITVRDYEDENITGLQAIVYDSDGDNVTSEVTVNTSNEGYIWINDTTWDFVDNQTLTVYIFKDVAPQDGVQEWNTSIDFELTEAPGAQWKWIDDDGAANTGYDNDGVIPEVPAIGDQPLTIEFQIISDAHAYYGDEASSNGAAPAEKGENITISGDALFLPTTLDEIPAGMVSFDGETWSVVLTPIMGLNGGEITFTYDWEDQGSDTKTLTVGGTDLNGTIVTINPTSFFYGTDTTFTVTVKDATGDPIKYADTVGLFWVELDGNLASAYPLVVNLTKGNANGEYTFSVNATQQQDNQTDVFGDLKAPRNISAYADTGSGYGYAITQMKQLSDLKVTVEPGTVMAAQKMSKIWFNTTVVNSAGNRTGWPEDSGLHVRIFNSTGEDVTGDTIGTISTGNLDDDANISLSNKYLYLPGTYTVYAYNDTHNSEGNNATIIVGAVDVTFDTSEIIWNVDENITVTFTVKYNGVLVNETGKLRIDNVSDQGDYNGTWYNSSFSVTNGIGADQGGNTSMEKTLTSGVVIINNMTANYLPSDESRENVTFYYKPKGSTYWAKATGVLPVKIANVAASPASISYNKATDLTITITGRNTPLQDVFVGIKVPGTSEYRNGTTNSLGQVKFGVTASVTGDILIQVENRTSDVVVPVTTWLLYVTADSQVNEGSSITVTVTNGTATGEAIAGAVVTLVNGASTGTTNAEGKATLTAPNLVASRTYSITATKDGYASATTDVMVINQPKLSIIASGTMDKEVYVSPVTITVADDQGNLITGVTVTFNGETKTTVDGQVTFTVTKEATGAVTATKALFADADPITITVKPAGVPGFELLVFVAALGVAFILLRRRK